jgi:hypothetical protein
MGRYLGWIALIVFAVWAFTDPSQAGNDVHGWFLGIITFFQHLAGK